MCLWTKSSKSLLRDCSIPPQKSQICFPGEKSKNMSMAWTAKTYMAHCAVKASLCLGTRKIDKRPCSSFCARPNYWDFFAFPFFSCDKVCVCFVYCLEGRTGIRKIDRSHRGPNNHCCGCISKLVCKDDGCYIAMKAAILKFFTPSSNFWQEVERFLKSDDFLWRAM